jgi:biopolymer transport protein ExbB/TolQ
MDTVALFTKLLDTALTLAVMGVVIWWLQRVLVQSNARTDAERAARLNAMDKEIERQRADLDRQRKRNDECERDRLEIHRELVELFRNNPDLARPRKGY